LLSLRDVSISYGVREGKVRVVDGVSFDVPRGEVTALIGESGSGKSTLSNAILGLLAANADIDSKSVIEFDGQDLLKLSPAELRRFRWQRASIVFQAAQNAMNPTLTIGTQLVDSVIDHGFDPRSVEVAERLERLLRMVRLDPSRVLGAYPHQLSGGMRQRAIIAMALVLQPEFVILDEPTTALDVITQSYIFDILQQIHQETRLTMLFITHDLPSVARLAHHVGVLRHGQLCEFTPAEEFFEQPRHEYSRALLDAIPSIEGKLGR
jgi:peptide/nickel transport system ATP-binding protein